MKNIKTYSIIIILLLMFTGFLPLCKAVDTDNDGMADEWEIQYGLNPENPNDATADSDKDGLSNIQEYLKTTDPTDPLSGGKIKVAYTYQNQITEEKINEILSHGINAVIVKGGLDNNIDYSLLPDQVPETIKQDAEIAQEKGYMFFAGFYFVHRHFFPNNSIVNGGYPVKYSDGVIGKQISPFCEAYWNHLTNIVVSLALLPVNYPNQYRLDGVMFDFELYGQTLDQRPSYFDASWGFENETFCAYLDNRQMSHPNPLPSNPYEWLVSRTLLNDYCTYLSMRIKDFAQNMKNQVKTINPDFLIGAYPSLTSCYYLSEIFSGWSSRYEPAVLWATEMYNTGGANQIPLGLENQLLPEGYYNLTEIYPSQSCSVTEEIYAYYISGVINYKYLSGNWAYTLYNLLIKTNGYWIFTTCSFTEPFETLNPDFRIMFYDEENNTISECENGEQYAEEVQDYYAQMDIAHSELRLYLNNSNYQSSLAPIYPPPTFYKDPLISLPDMQLFPLDDQSTYQPLNLELKRFRNQQNFAIYAHENQLVEINLSSINYHTSDIQYGLIYIVLAPNSIEITRGTLTDDQETTITFLSTMTGNYFLLIQPMEGFFEISKTNAPLSLYKNIDEPIHIISRPCSFYFWVGDVSNFIINISGQGTLEGAHVIVSHSNGAGYDTVTSGETTLNHNRFTLDVTVPFDARNRIWKMEISQPSTPQRLEDVWITFNQNIDPYFGLTDDKRYFLVETGIGNHSGEGDSDPPSNSGFPSGGGFFPDTNETKLNKPPNTPMKPSGPTFIERGVTYTYTSSAFHPDGDQVRIRFDWGDGTLSNWSAFFDSNTSISSSYAWNSISTYSIRVIAQDKNGTNSSWSPTLSVTISET
ncbi:MAG: PKD domain-containing protein, partial [Thermoplasmata archaeon]|nr:PKD domain-containing protein [Thermoplasmata archaeon]